MAGKMKVPKLRFPEFEGEWEEKKLGEVVTFQRGFDLPSFERLEGDIPVVSSSGVSGYHNESKISPPGIVTGRYGSIGDLFYLEEPFWPLNTSLFVSHFHENNPKYVYFYLHRINFKKLSDKTGVPGVNRNDLHKIRASRTPLPEQQKIAAFLTTIDTRIQQLRRKKNLLEQYKKGVMQQIFSQEIRFKDEDGKEYPAWEEKQLGAVFTFCQTNSLSRSLLNYERGAVKNIHYGDIHTKFSTIFDLSKEEVPFINESVDLSKIADENYCKVGDLIIADASEDYKDVGKAIEVVNLAGQTLLAGLHTLIVRDVKKQTVTGFKGYMMQTYNVRQQIMRLATGVSVLGISKGNLSKVKVPLPSLSEQQKIATFLSSLDHQINLVSQQLERMQTFKKGLLQQMFV